jgi:predicted DNA repair protein MutK
MPLMIIAVAYIIFEGGYSLFESHQEKRLQKDLEQYKKIQDAIREALEYAEENKEFFEVVVRTIVLSDQSYIDILKRIIEENEDNE